MNQQDFENQLSAYFSDELEADQITLQSTKKAIRMNRKKKLDYVLILPLMCINIALVLFTIYSPFSLIYFGPISDILHLSFIYANVSSLLLCLLLIRYQSIIYKSGGKF